MRGLYTLCFLGLISSLALITSCGDDDSGGSDLPTVDYSCELKCSPDDLTISGQYGPAQNEESCEAYAFLNRCATNELLNPGTCEMPITPVPTCRVTGCLIPPEPTCIACNPDAPIANPGYCAPS